jgi:hypothetical protein
MHLGRLDRENRPRAPDVIDEHVAGDAVQESRVRPAAPTVTAQRLKSAQEDLLGQVLSVAIVEHPCAHVGVDHRQVPLVEIGEGVPVALPSPRDQFILVQDRGHASTLDNGTCRPALHPPIAGYHDWLLLTIVGLHRWSLGTTRPE